MKNYDIHQPSFAGKTVDSWEFPAEQDFATSDLSVIAEHFLLSASGFDDPNEFADLRLPVVTSQGYLSINGLWAARHGPYSVEHITDIDPEMKAEALSVIDDLGTENFGAYENDTATEPGWETTTESRPVASAGEIVDSTNDTVETSCSPRSAVVGLAFLFVTAAIAGSNCGSEQK
jgi:hypothetical protein